MSWLYLPELVEGYSEASSSDGAPSVQLSLIPTASKSSSNDNGMDCLNPSPSGTMSRPSTGDPGVDLFLLSVGASRARTCPVPPPQGKDSTETTADCGEKWPVSWVRYDLLTSSWRTRQYSMFGGLAEFSGTWPRWGTMRGGECWARDTLVPLTDEIGCGFLPTPAAVEYGNNQGGGAGRVGPVRHSLASMARHNLWPTPTRRDWKSGKASPETHDRNARPLSEAVGRDTPGYLNPDWVEGYLMGWPIGWTSLEPIGWGDWWDQTWWDDERCPRVTTIKTNRVNRLKAIGNGQVPACVVMAWELLT